MPSYESEEEGKKKEQISQEIKQDDPDFWSRIIPQSEIQEYSKERESIPIFLPPRRKRSIQYNFEDIKQETKITKKKINKKKEKNLKKKMKKDKKNKKDYLLGI